MQKAYDLANKIIFDVNDFCDNYTKEDGSSVHSEDMMNALDNIIKSGLILYKYLQEKELYTGIPTVTADMVELSKYASKLEMTEENAKKLDLSNALQIWTQMKFIIAQLACDLLDYKDSIN